MSKLEVKYLLVSWAGPETVEKLEVSRDALDVELIEGQWQVETTTYPVDEYGQYLRVGIRIKDADLQHPPYVLMANGSHQPLLEVKAPGSDVSWWIEHGGWKGNGKNKYYESVLATTAGRMDVMIQSRCLTILNHTFNFSVEELEYYLSDFKNNLWTLILESSSPTKASVVKQSGGFLNEHLLQLLHEFIASTEQLIENPSVELKETQSKQPIRNVKPLPRTFREFTAKPHEKHFTSRAYEQSLDTPENRFICYWVDRLSKLAKILSITAKAQHFAFTRKISQEDSLLHDLSANKQTKRVNSVVYDNEIAQLEHSVAELPTVLSSAVTSGHEPRYLNDAIFMQYQIEVGMNYGKDSNKREFFSKYLDGQLFKETFGTYLVIGLPPTFPIQVIDKIRGCIVNVSGICKRTRKYNNKDSFYYLINFIQIFEMTLHWSPLMAELEALRKKRPELEKSEWYVRLSNTEINERQKDIRVSQNRIKYWQNLCSDLDSYTENLPKVSSGLQKLASFFATNKVKKCADRPNGMIFIQNPSYAAVKSLIKKITLQKGLTDNNLQALLEVDEIGLVNISNLYEKWCLLQILKVLVDVLGFHSDGDWQSRLTKAVLNNEKDIEFVLYSKERQQKIVLTYEKLLNSGKRPDFVIDLFSHDYQWDDKANIYVVANKLNRARIVLDAKFKGNISEADLEKLVQEMYSAKDYSEGEANNVFVLHATSNVIRKQTSPLDWGSSSDYGQGSKHKYGSIFLSPSLNFPNSVKNLQRLLGYFLQKNSQILERKDVPFTPGPLALKESIKAMWHNFTCISCGAYGDDIDVVSERGRPDRWVIKCKCCHMTTVKTHCYQCKAILFKNGSQWTYHQTRAEQVYNIVCPSCRTFFKADNEIKHSKTSGY